jgi:arylsulfatase A-like enzyme
MRSVRAALFRLAAPALLAALVFAAGCSTSNGSAQNPPAKPNVVLVLADDMGWNDVGYHGSEIKTPAIDRLAKTGVKLEQFYAQSICSPTRACLMTGRYTMRYGFQTGVVLPWSQYGLPTTERTLAEALQSAGYYTAICGKWHIGHAEAKYLPTRRGFDHAYGYYNGAIDHFTHMRDEGLDWQRGDGPLEEDGYATTLIAREAVRVIEGRDKTRPLFLYVAFSAPHQPLQAPAEYLERYKSIENGPRRRYAAMVSCMDDAIAEILRALEKQGMDRNTLVLFLSDNGAETHIGSNRPYRGGKGELYEGGIRVPALANWPGVLSPRVVNEPLVVADLYPTLLSLAGAPPQTAPPLDGMDVWPVLRQGAPLQRKEILLEASQVRGAIRAGDWKLVYNGHLNGLEASARGRDAYELFNLAADPGERQDLSAQYPKIRDGLEARLDEYRKRSVPPFYTSVETPAGYRAPKYWARFPAEKRR